MRFGESTTATCRFSDHSGVTLAALIVTALTLLGVPSLVTAQLQATGTLISWWPGDDNADDVQDGNHGTLQNGATIETCPIGRAFSFDGLNDFVSVPDAANLDFQGALTIEAWIFPMTFPPPYPAIVGKWDAVAVNQRSYVFHLDAAGRVYFRASPNGLELGFGVGTVISNSTVPIGQWTHVAGVYDGTSMSVYINGQLDNQVAYNQGIFAGTNDFSIGATIGGAGPGQFIGPFGGLIDEVKVYDYGLSSVDIAAAHDNGNFNPCGSVACSGFKPPMENFPVKAKKNRVFPLKLELFDEAGLELSDVDIAAPPVVQVLFTPLNGVPIDVTENALSSGAGTEGNQFEYSDDGHWQFNLKSSNHTAEGEYVVTAASGDESEYTIDPSCVTSFAIEQ